MVSAESRRFDRRGAGLAVLVLVLVTVLFHFTSFRNGHDWGGDFSAYIHQAKALAEGNIEQFYETSAFRVGKSAPELVVGPPSYPWGFPMLLSLVYAIFGMDLLPMKSLILAFIVGIQVATFFLTRRRLPTSGALLLAFAMGFSPFFFYFKNEILSDIPLVFFVLLSLILMQRFLIDRRALIHPVIDNMLLGAVVCFAYLTRTHGLALMTTLPVIQCCEAYKRWRGPDEHARRYGIAVRLSAALAPYLVFVAGVFAALEYFAAPESTYEYVASGHFQFFGIRIFLSTTAYNIGYYAYMPSRFIDNGLFAVAADVLVLLPLVLYGVFRRFSKDYLLVVFAVFHMGVLILFPMTGGLRFMLPVIPLCWYFALAGMFELQSGRLLPRLVFVVGLLCLFVYPGVRSAVRWMNLRAEPGSVMEGPYRETSLEVFDFIEEHTEESSVFVFWKPRVLTLYTARHSVLWLEPNDLVNSTADFLLIYTGGEMDVFNSGFLRAVAVREADFVLVFKNADFLLYRIAPRSAAVARAGGKWDQPHKVQLPVIKT